MSGDCTTCHIAAKALDATARMTAYRAKMIVALNELTEAESVRDSLVGQLSALTDRVNTVRLRNADMEAQIASLNAQIDANRAKIEYDRCTPGHPVNSPVEVSCGKL